MKIYSVSVLDSRNRVDKTNFTGARLPAKWAIRKVPEQTLKNVSAALSATGMADLMMEQSNKDYVDAIAVSIDRLNLNDEDMQAVKMGYDIYPVLMDTLLSTTDKRNELRDINKKSIEKITQSYDINPDLTEELLIAKDKKGAFVYTISEISHIVNANEINPELLEFSKRHPVFVNSLLNRTNEEGQPCFGVEDVRNYCKAREIDKKLTEKILNQRVKNGNARFDGATALVVVKNKDDEFMQYLLEAQNHGSMRLDSVFRLTGDELYSIYSMCKTDEQKKLAKDLLEVSFKNYEYQEYLKPDDVKMILRSPMDEIVKRFSNYRDKEKLNKIIELVNRVPNAEEFSKILKLRNEYKQAIFSSDEVEKLVPDKGTVLAAQIIADRNLSSFDKHKVIYHSIMQPELLEKVMKSEYSVYDRNTFFQKQETFKFEFLDAIAILDKAEKQPELAEQLLKFIYRTNIKLSDMFEISGKISSLIVDCLEMAEVLPDWYVKHLIEDNLIGENKDTALCGLDKINYQMYCQLKNG